MRVYKVECDVNAFRVLSPVDKSVFARDDLDFQCKPKGDNWKPPTMYCPDPLEPKPDFPYLEAPGSLAVEPDRFEHVQTHFEMAGEILGLPFDRRILKVLNVLKCINCLNHEECKWITTKSGRRLFPKGDGYAFHPDRFDESSIFKIPETHKAMIYCWERENDPETEFKAAVDKHKLLGLTFTLLWNSKE